MNTLPASVQKLIDHFSKLPGIGPKSASRMVFHLLYAPVEASNDFAESLMQVKAKISFCKICSNLAEDDEVCLICSNGDRIQSEILVVEDVLDLFAFERIGEYKGLYHVLGGVISPVLGVGPEDLTISALFKRIRQLKGVKEVIIATNPNLEGEATGMYIKEELVSEPDLKVTRIARGVPTGADLDYADRITLKRALQGRTAL